VGEEPQRAPDAEARARLESLAFIVMMAMARPEVASGLTMIVRTGVLGVIASIVLVMVLVLVTKGSVVVARLAPGGVTHDRSPSRQG
jgi:hypothetical protein